MLNPRKTHVKNENTAAESRWNRIIAKIRNRRRTFRGSSTNSNSNKSKHLRQDQLQPRYHVLPLVVIKMITKCREFSECVLRSRCSTLRRCETKTLHTRFTVVTLTSTRIFACRSVFFPNFPIITNTIFICPTRTCYE